MPEIIVPKDGVVTIEGQRVAFFSLTPFCQAYIEALIGFENEPFTTRAERDADREEWDERAREGQQKEIPGDFGFADMAPRTVAEAIADCAAFQAEAAELLALAADNGYDDTNAGHDLWLTRNGHGAGFWDRDALSECVPETDETLGDLLSDVARKMGNLDVYLGDDDLIYT